MKTLSAVDHPLHYNAGDIECIEAIEAQLSREEFIGYLRGQVAKYNWRMRLKGAEVEDCRKLLWYGERLRKVLERSLVEVRSTANGIESAGVEQVEDAGDSTEIACRSIAASDHA